MAKYSLHTSRSRLSKILITIMIVIAVILGVTVIAIRRVYDTNLRPVSTSQKSQLVTVEKGSSVKQVAAELKELNLIRSSWAFEWYVRNHNLRDKVQAGTYSLRPNLSAPEIVTILTKGKVETALVTILPAQRLDQVKESFINKYGFNADEVETAFNPDNYADHPALVDKPRGASLEGYLYPESFQKTAATKAATIVRASLDEMQKHLTPELRAGIVRQGLTVHQGVILASIIEQEVNKAEDKPIVAQVFLKRLRTPMQLGSDVTAFYGAIMAGKEPSVIYDSPYNTRLHDGMPPGPISNVSAASLSAVANPANTNFVYFVAGDGPDTGKTYFSHTLEEHEQLTREHCKKLCN